VFRLPRQDLLAQENPRETLRPPEGILHLLKPGTLKRENLPDGGWGQIGSQEMRGEDYFRDSLVPKCTQMQERLVQGPTSIIEPWEKVVMKVRQRTNEAPGQLESNLLLCSKLNRGCIPFAASL
jgi:hypothetical protein